MRKTILTILGSALLAASTVQIAAAAEHKNRKAESAPPLVSEPVRDANASAFYPAPLPNWSRYYEGGAISAPAGR
jgi:hypothetical protein